MNKLQACEKRYANLKTLWMRDLQIKKELLEACETLIEWGDYHDPNCGVDNCPVCGAYIKAQESIDRARATI